MRRTGLVVFGCLQLVFGCFTLFALLWTTARPRFNVVTTQFNLAALTFYFFATGIGSIRGRRWAIPRSRPMRSTPSGAGPTARRCRS